MLVTLYLNLKDMIISNQKYFLQIGWGLFFVCVGGILISP